MRSYTLLLAAAAAALAVPAAAAQAEETASVTVNIADLDLNSEADVARLDRRIRNAADDVCGAPGSNSLSAQRMFATCRERAISGVDGQVRELVAASSQSNVRMAARINVRKR